MLTFNFNVYLPGKFLSNKLSTRFFSPLHERIYPGNTAK